jgi:sterol desaturase/sphingolipid hydroxylase (fatty acid hydroxylase superfamily)
MSMSEWIQVYGGDLQVALFFFLFPILVVAERFIPRRSVGTDRRHRWVTNIGLTVINLVVLSALPLSFIVAAHWASTQGWGLLNVVALPVLLTIIANLLLRGFLSFLTHLLMHKVPLLWRIHRVHHLDTDLDVSSTVRFHPAEFIVGLCIGLPFVALLGLTPWVLVLYELFDVCVTLWSHSNTRLSASVDKVLRYFVVTPNLHRVHHSTWQPETDSNFGAVFPLWDIVFGTFRPTPRTNHEIMPLGLEEMRGSRANSLAWLLVSPVYAKLTDVPIDTMAGTTTPIREARSQ